jgi:hypothetical protein
MRLCAVAAASSLAALVVAPPAGAVIVVQQGIAGIRIGMTQAKVRAKLGKPRSFKHGTNEFGKYTELRYRGLRITFQGDRTVTSIWTSSPRERTARGIGVGSTRAAVRARVEGVRCGRGHCFVGRFLPGRRVTDFFLRNGRVSAVVVGFVID